MKIFFIIGLFIILILFIYVLLGISIYRKQLTLTKNNKRKSIIKTILYSVIDLIEKILRFR